MMTGEIKKTNVHKHHIPDNTPDTVLRDTDKEQMWSISSINDTFTVKQVSLKGKYTLDQGLSIEFNKKSCEPNFRYSSGNFRETSLKHKDVFTVNGQDISAAGGERGLFSEAAHSYLLEQLKTEKQTIIIHGKTIVWNLSNGTQAFDSGLSRCKEVKAKSDALASKKANAL